MNVTIATAAYPITYHHNWQEWVSHTQTLIQQAVNNNAQIILFPEYGSMELSSILSKELQDDLQGQIYAMQSFLPDYTAIFSRFSEEYNVIIIAPSFPVRLASHYVNRTFVFSPNGNIAHQDKWFMTRFENEIWGISSIENILTIFETKWGNFGIQTCYDIEFPIGSHLLTAHGATMIMVPSCTETIRGAHRVHIGARARALESQCYTIVSQTIGEALWSPAVDINYGWCAAYATPDFAFPDNGCLAEGAHNHAGWTYVTLDNELLANVRTESQVLNFKDAQEIDMGLYNKEIAIRKIQL